MFPKKRLKVIRLLRQSVSTWLMRMMNCSYGSLSCSSTFFTIVLHINVESPLYLASDVVPAVCKYDNHVDDDARAPNHLQQHHQRITTTRKYTHENTLSNFTFIILFLFFIFVPISLRYLFLLWYPIDPVQFLQQ